MEYKFEVGDKVKKEGGDYRYSGVVVENSDGMLFIFNGAQLDQV